MVHARLAPTPSGFLHRGNAYNFLLTAAHTRKRGGSLRLRIDDGDAPRKRPEYVQDIFDTLHWLGIEWTHGPKGAAEHEAHFAQPHRKALYTRALDTLRNAGFLYACACSRKALADGQGRCRCAAKALPFNTREAAWRLRLSADAVVEVDDTHLGKAQIPIGVSTPDPVLRRRDGWPAYQLTSLVDDVHYGINFIVRGEDLLESTAIQLHLASLLCYTAFGDAIFLHHPLLKSAEGEKLSKSAGAASIRQLRESGVTTEAFLQGFEGWRTHLKL